jgi:CubicO group peptidase (beta-lactamase class C family)
MPSAPLPRSTPADQGVSSAAVTAFLDTLDAAPDIELHSLMLLRHGHVVAEGWWRPYRPDQVHLLYSLSKSFTATAAGLAAAEGLLSFDDPVVAHFPELADVATHPWTLSMRVRHLAAMATGHRTDTLERAVRLDPAEPVRGFLSIAPDAEPGSVFAYNNGATYTLGAIVQRVTGQLLTAYLQPRLFDPLGIDAPFWYGHAEGRELGFSGLHLTTEAIARFGQLYLDDGVWQGTRLLPEGWVAEASRLHTPNPDEPNPDWQQGYGYQLWRSRHGYRGDGAYGQFCLVLPEQDSVLVTTAQTENMQGILDAVWAHLVPALGTATPEEDEALARRLADVRLPADGTDAAGRGQPADAASTHVTRLEDDREGGWRLTLTDGDHELVLRCGNGTWQQNSLALPGSRRVEIAASGTGDAASLVVQLAFVQTPHRLVLTVDRPSLASSARWLSVPLHAPTLAGLAVGAR